MPVFAATVGWDADAAAWVQAGATAVLVLITLAYVIVTGRMTARAGRSAQASERAADAAQQSAQSTAKAADANERASLLGVMPVVVPQIWSLARQIGGSPDQRPDTVDIKVTNISPARAYHVTMFLAPHSEAESDDVGASWSDGSQEEQIGGDMSLADVDGHEEDIAMYAVDQNKLSERMNRGWDLVVQYHDAFGGESRLRHRPMDKIWRIYRRQHDGYWARIEPASLGR